MSIIKKVIISIFVSLLLVFFAGFFVWFVNSAKQVELPAVSQNTNEIKLIKDKEPKITITFAGDMMFGRLVGHHHQDNNFQTLLENFDTSIFANSDIAWANLEGPVSDQVVKQDLSKENLERLNFLFSNQTVTALKNLKLNVVGLANNHTYNNGIEGLKMTQKLLEENGINWHGHPTEVGTNSVFRFQKDNFVVSFIAVHALYGESHVGLEELISIEKARGNFVIVLPHWGEEYETFHSPLQEKYAKSWVESGAHMIIGTHPHVVQDAQIIKRSDGTETLVFYSLGNFIFDQTFSEETKLGLIIKMVVEPNKAININLIPIEAINLKPQYADSEKTKMIIERICQNIKSYCDSDSGSVRLPI